MVPGVLVPAHPVRARTHRIQFVLPLRFWIVPVLVGSAVLPERPRDLLALVAIILLGIPHGALDGELGRTALRPRFGRLWFLVFSLPYLALSACVLLAWRWQPEAVLAVFLLASVLHFGREETGSTRLVPVLAAGGATIALTVLSHPVATAGIFGTVAGLPWSRPPVWLEAASLLWIVPASIAVSGLVRDRDTAGLTRMLLIAAAAILLPPLTAFALYFVCIHAPAHVDGLIRDRRLAPRITGAASVVRLSAAVTLLTLVLGAALWPLYQGPALPRLLCLTIQGLAALTLPHMLMEGWLARHAAA